MSSKWDHKSSDHHHDDGNDNDDHKKSNNENHNNNSATTRHKDTKDSKDSRDNNNSSSKDSKGPRRKKRKSLFDVGPDEMMEIGLKGTILGVMPPQSPSTSVTTGNILRVNPYRNSFGIMINPLVPPPPPSSSTSSSTASTATLFSDHPPLSSSSSSLHAPLPPPPTTTATSFPFSHHHPSHHHHHPPHMHHSHHPHHHHSLGSGTTAPPPPPIPTIVPPPLPPSSSLSLSHSHPQQQHLQQHMQQQQQSNEQRQMRRVYVGNIPKDCTESEIVSFFVHTLNRAFPEEFSSLSSLSSSYHDNTTMPPMDASQITCTSFNYEKSFVFIDFANARQATLAMALDGIQLRPHSTSIMHHNMLKIRRPKDYRAPPTGDPSLLIDRVKMSHNLSLSSIPSSSSTTTATTTTTAIPTLSSSTSIQPPPSIMAPPTSTSLPTSSSVSLPTSVSSVSTPSIISTNVLDTPNKLFIGGLPSTMTEDQVLKFLSHFGPLKAFNLVKDMNTGLSKGYAFCEYLNGDKHTDDAIKAMNGMEMANNKRLVVQRASVGAKSSSQSQQSQSQSQSSSSQVDQSDSLSLSSSDATGGGGGGSSGSSDELSFILNLSNRIETVLAYTAQHSAVQLEPTRFLVLYNMLSESDTLRDEVYHEIYDDIRCECSKYGHIQNMVIPRHHPSASNAIGDQQQQQTQQQESTNSSSNNTMVIMSRVLIEYSSVQEAQRAQQALAGRKYQGRMVVTSYCTEQDFHQQI